MPSGDPWFLVRIEIDNNTLPAGIRFDTGAGDGRNEFGKFIYHSIKKSLFFGYQQIHVKSEPYLIAEPEKALLDFLYFKKSKIKAKEDIASFRFNWKSIKEKVDVKKLKKYLKIFNNKKLDKIVAIFWEEGALHA